jgi:osmotically inducible protein OsmC
MALSHGLSQAGTPPQTVDTSAEVDFQPGTGITAIRLKVRASVPGLTAEQFAEAAESAKTGCPVSQALSAVPISLDAELLG